MMNEKKTLNVIFPAEGDIILLDAKPSPKVFNYDRVADEERESGMFTLPLISCALTTV